jgi:hypothetical protein
LVSRISIAVFLALTGWGALGQQYPFLPVAGSPKFPGQRAGESDAGPFRMCMVRRRRGKRIRLRQRRSCRAVRRGESEIQDSRRAGRHYGVVGRQPAGSRASRLLYVATRANGLPGLIDALPAKDGTIWLGTTNGLYRLASPFQVEYWTIREGLAYPPWSIARSDGRVYAGLDRGRIVVLDNDRLRWNAVADFDRRGTVSGLVVVFRARPNLAVGPQQRDSLIAKAREDGSVFHPWTPPVASSAGCVPGPSRKGAGVTNRPGHWTQP